MSQPKKYKRKARTGGRQKLEYVKTVPKFLQKFGGMINDPNFREKAESAAEEWREDYQQKQKLALAQEQAEEDKRAYEDAKKFGNIVSEADAMTSAERNKAEKKKRKLEERKEVNEKDEKINKVIQSFSSSEASEKKRSRKKKHKNKKKLNNKMLLSFDADDLA
mmetsp:Transcript_14143/g.16559  ORF Transcript_14143/g.16559 Transcript_14143/m.16559 type:complete len:164 (-) Transcript_14143:332-823(-)|eukprot:CAMPEP_0184024280 /NCGR_PEP_ID=MMETSP0954-20121128/11976_1 /TAXON_ID=627963 /ORGANISM="Aplanochytrium sp, Strain PBS07" /LENGTH=163 /DNA_ID=CAMNT_0026307553 /DNA_START=108 /DNA_END=599 /DNA_ORIENTATION=-